MMQAELRVCIIATVSSACALACGGARWEAADDRVPLVDRRHRSSTPYRVANAATTTNSLQAKSLPCASRTMRVG